MSILTEEEVLDTLRRVDDRIILAIAGREFEMTSCTTCVCGWVLREKLAEIHNARASTIDFWDEPFPPGMMGRVTGLCATLVGGSESEWEAIFSGVCYDVNLPAVERAFAQRLDEAVGR